jgi:hypothetical protein
MTQKTSSSASPMISGTARCSMSLMIAMPRGFGADDRTVLSALADNAILIIAIALLAA